MSLSNRRTCDGQSSAAWSIPTAIQIVRALILAVAISTSNFLTAAPYGAYIFLGAICILSTFYVYFLVPETKNRTLDELDELFGDQSGRSKMEAAYLLQAQKDVGLLALADLAIDDDHSPEKTDVAHVKSESSA